MLARLLPAVPWIFLLLSAGPVAAVDGRTVVAMGHAPQAQALPDRTTRNMAGQRWWYAHLVDRDGAIIARPASGDRAGKGPVLLAQGPGEKGKTSDAPPPKFYGHDLVLRGCVVTGARLVYQKGDHVDSNLISPRRYSAPAPGQNSDLVGPSVGPEPNTVPQTFLTANIFEYHSDLNGVDGCSSKQYALDYRIRINRTTGSVSDAKDRGLDPRVLSGKSAWPEDRIPPGLPITQTTLPQRSLYDGNTFTGRKPPSGDGVYYEGTKDKIHWLDGPGWEIPADPGSPDALVLIALIKSETRGSNRDHGRFCLSGHTIVVDVSTGRPMDAAAVRTMFDSAAPRGGSSASGILKNASNTLHATPAQGGFQGTVNPEFQDLGCYSF